MLSVTKIKRKSIHFMATHTMSIVALLLLMSLITTMWFLYWYFYQPLNNLPVLYSLQSGTASTQIESAVVEAAYNAIEEKKERPLPSLSTISSPF